MLQLRSRRKKEKREVHETIINLSTLVGSSGFFVNVFSTVTKGECTVAGLPASREDLSARGSRSRDEASRARGTEEGNARYDSGPVTIFLTGLAKRSSPANGRSGYWFSMADQRGSKQKVPTRRSSAGQRSTQQSRDNIVGGQTRIPCLCDFLDQPSDLGIAERLSAKHS